jgi:MFS family permease
VFVIVVLGLAQSGMIWAGDIRSEGLFLFSAFLSGFGGGAIYPLFAALTPDCFGENYNATNYGLIYSGKLISGLFGGVSLVAVAIALLRQPGRDAARTPRPRTVG